MIIQSVVLFYINIFIYHLNKLTVIIVVYMQNNSISYVYEMILLE